MLNHKTIFKQKSKILLTIICIFGLAFSYSCSCRSPEEPPTGGGTFAPRLDLGNSYNVSFTSAGVEKLHASVKFIEPNKYGYKAEITEVTDGKGEITKDKIQYNDDGTFTIDTSTLQALAGKLNSTDKPATNEVSITFKLTSTDTTLNNNTTNITQTFNFIKAKKIDSSNIESILRKGEVFEQIDTDSGPQVGKTEFRFYFNYGTFTEVGKVYTITNNTTDNYAKGGISKALAKNYIGYNFDTKLTNEGIKGTPSTVDYESEGANFYTLSYDITYGDLYEGDITPIKVRLENKSSLQFTD